MKVLGIYDKSGPKYHRILLPLSLMPGVELTIASTVTPENADCDILFFNRAISYNSLNMILNLKKRFGFSMICDLDDHWILSPDHFLYDQYRHGRISEVIEAYIAESDLVITTHERLKKEALKVNKNVEIIPNAIPEFGQFTFPKTQSATTRLFWAGSITHEKDIELLRNPVNRLRHLPVKMVMGGYSEHPAYRRMASAFTSGGRMRHQILENEPVESYYAAYSECDIALIPLAKSTFNGYKSNLKILEAANIGAPVVVSRVDPYLGFPEDLVNYVDRSSDWYYHVKRLLKGTDQGERLKAYCKEHFNFTRINEKRKELFIKYAPVREIQGKTDRVAI